jgi:hypothetical protein
MIDKEFVQAHWVGARFESVFENSKAWLHQPQVQLPRDRGRILCEQPSGVVWILSGNANTPFEIAKALPEDAAWAIAAEFTRDRLKDIAELELAIETAFCLHPEETNCATCELTQPIRKIADAALAELKRGMK